MNAMTEMAPRIGCMAPGCTNEGTDMPVVFFGPGDTRTGAIARKQVAMLEIPRLVCSEHAKTFQPATYMTEESRKGCAGWLSANGFDAPSWKWFSVAWLPRASSVYQELRDTGQARLTGGHNYVIREA